MAKAGSTRAIPRKPASLPEPLSADSSLLHRVGCELTCECMYACAHMHYFHAHARSRQTMVGMVASAVGSGIATDLVAVCRLVGSRCLTDLAEHFLHAHIQATQRQIAEADNANLLLVCMLIVPIMTVAAVTVGDCVAPQPTPITSSRPRPRRGSNKLPSSSPSSWR